MPTNVPVGRQRGGGGECIAAFADAARGAAGAFDDASSHASPRESAMYDSSHRLRNRIANMHKHSDRSANSSNRSRTRRSLLSFASHDSATSSAPRLAHSGSALLALPLATTTTSPRPIHPCRCLTSWTTTKQQGRGSHRCRTPGSTSTFDPYLVARPGARGAQQFESVGDVVGDEQFTSSFIVGSVSLSARHISDGMTVM